MSSSPDAEICQTIRRLMPGQAALQLTQRVAKYPA
ncbi:MAG: hypothetical protein JWL60_77 [Gemmatimonadetes bacterium]|jgi:hypothetical protein|nr:hypothetical protein [Gemmatimonadota bacterium]